MFLLNKKKKEKKTFLLFFPDFKFFMFHYNIVKISEIFKQVELVENLHRFMHVITKTRLVKYIETFTTKNWVFR